MKNDNLNRFVAAHQQMYSIALEEIGAGKKVSHWMWYIFPQLAGLGKSEVARFYGIADIKEAADYLAHPVVGRNLIAITTAVLNLDGITAHQIFGSPDDVKLLSSMTLFASVDNAPAVFGQVVDKYFDGHYDTLTLKMLERGM